MANEYPPIFYAPFSEENYDLGFGRHEKTLVLTSKTEDLTDFRNGDLNLHFLHVNKERRGRTCRACHQTHASNLPRQQRILKGLSQNWPARQNAKNIVVAIDDPNSHTFFRSDPNEPAVGVHVVADTKYKLWGKFGIIATPTVIISDTNDTVLWVKAGHSYDFVPVIRARLNQALGIAQEIDPNDASRVKTVTNATVTARVKRHLQMAKMLQAKGDKDKAIAAYYQALTLVFGRR